MQLLAPRHTAGTPASHPVVHLKVPHRERVPVAARVGYLALGRERASEQLARITEAHDTSWCPSSEYTHYQRHCGHSGQ